MCSRETAVTAVLDVIVSDEVFDTAWNACNVGRSRHINAVVSKVAGPANGTSQKFSIDDRSTTNTSAKSDHHHVFKPFGSTKPRFTEQRGMSIVQDGDFFAGA